ncbi:DinB family protein, partial [Singulisphaera rosea]
MSIEQSLREHLRDLLVGSQAHVDFETAIADIPVDHRGSKPKGMPHTPWRLVEHMRIAQWDILEFSRNPSHVSPEFPIGYWPSGNVPPNAAAWDHSVDAFRKDLKAMVALVT